VYLVGGKGDTWRNGKPVREGTEVALDIHDRVGMGDQLMVRLGPIYLSPIYLAPIYLATNSWCV
jgi:hypothetical protein